MKLILDNAQSGGAQIRVESKGTTLGYIYPRGDEEMTYFDFAGEKKTLKEMPEKDGIEIFSDEDL